MVLSLVSDCHIAPAELGRTNTINIVWVPGHNGVYGYKRAAQFHNIVSDIDFIGLEPAFGILFSILLNKTNQCCFNSHYNYWDLQKY